MSSKRVLVLLGALCVALSTRSSALQRVDAQGLQLRIGFARPGGGYAIQTLPLETYIARVLAGEAARESPAAALEALAITIRTYALGNRDRHRADGFDLCDETHCQVVRTATPATTRAAEATAGQILMSSGQVASVFYSASCGGRSEIPSNVWPGAEDPPYLPTAEDDACLRAPEWEAHLRGADLLRAFRAAGFRGDQLRDLRITSRNSSDRVARLQVVGLTPSEVSGQDLRVIVGRTLGWQHIKSAAFDVRWSGAGYRFTGHGSGHGVGLCVIGSTNLAARGTTAPAILQKYFPGTVIATAGASPAPPGNVLVSLPDADEGDRAAITRLADAARGEIAGALGVTPQSPITIRFHTTTSDYERATGHRWFTSGAWVRNEVHLAPLVTLRARGVLDRTVRHAIVHAMVDEVLANRPAWVREGAALYFSGERSLPERREACPQDSELLQPVSAGALADAYARARSCFTRQINDGRNWRDVR
ncbi:MAG TPA: SpoIID/LytB domain-containing protein [Vicinamibacterales bacterium]|nr:SpoIID/LytB domain-containing protein [Vicinamibacterales bacterium]